MLYGQAPPRTQGWSLPITHAQRHSVSESHDGQVSPNEVVGAWR